MVGRWRGDGFLLAHLRGKVFGGKALCQGETAEMVFCLPAAVLSAGFGELSVKAGIGLRPLTLYACSSDCIAGGVSKSSLLSPYPLKPLEKWRERRRWWPEKSSPFCLRTISTISPDLPGLTLRAESGGRVKGGKRGSGGLLEKPSQLALSAPRKSPVATMAFAGVRWAGAVSSGR